MSKQSRSLEFRSIRFYVRFTASTREPHFSRRMLVVSPAVHAHVIDGIVSAQCEGFYVIDFKPMRAAQADVHLPDPHTGNGAELRFANVA